MDALIGIAVVLGGFAVIYLIVNIVGRDGKDPNNVSPDSEKPLRRVVAAIRPVWQRLLRKRGLWWRAALWVAAGIAAVLFDIVGLWVAALVSRLAILVSINFYQLIKKRLANFGLWGRVALWVTTGIAAVIAVVLILWMSLIVAALLMDMIVHGEPVFVTRNTLPIIYDTLIDERDGKKYKTVKIGHQWWMAENLNYETDSSWCLEDSISYCDKYGRLYNWNAAMRTCPYGWHLPSCHDWIELLRHVTKSQLDDESYVIRNGAGKKLKAKSGWNDYVSILSCTNSKSGNGIDDYGFSALPGGARREGGSFYGRNRYGGYWWTATEISDSKIGGEARELSISHDGSYVVLSSTRTSHGLSVRCVADAP